MAEGKGPPSNFELCQQMNPVASIAIKVLTSVRLAILLSCFKWMWIIRYSIFVELLLVPLVEIFLPSQIGSAQDFNMALMMSFLNTELYYFEFKRHCAFGFLPVLFTAIRRYLFHAESLEDMSGILVSMIFAVPASLILVHLIITKVGMIFVNAIVLRAGNDQVLDNLEEGVVILDEASHEILYSNKAASGIRNQSDEFESLLQSRLDMMAFLVNKEEP